MEWTYRKVKRKYRQPEHEYWALIVSVYDESKWSYRQLKETPSGWMRQFIIALDEYRKEQARKQKIAERDAKRKARNRPKIR